MRYLLDFGDGTEGTTPTFLVFKNADTLADITPPTVVEVAQGLFYFDWNWANTTATSISYKASTLGVELSDVITSDAIVTGSGTASTSIAIPDWAWTAGQVINTVAVECGLTEWSDPYASTDANAVRLRTLLKTVGHELVKARDWKPLVREMTITGDGVNATFTLPGDFDRLVDDSGWNRTGTEPLALLSSQGWQALKAEASVDATEVYFRIVQNRITFYTAPVSGDTIAAEYVSRYWVAASGSTTADKMAPTASGDWIILDPLLVKRCLAARFLAATGQVSRAEADALFRGAIADEPSEPAPVLSLSNSRSDFYPYFNVRDRGYGS